jgi:nitroreductase
MSAEQDKATIQLLQPREGSGNPAIELLWKRQSSREFSPEPLPVSVLSNLLWAGFGINRPGGMRTAPSAMNWQDMDIYVILSDGLYLYEAKANQLKLLRAEDLRALAGTQDYVKEAPVNLVYVSDYAKMESNMPDEAKTLLSGAHTGAIVENIYLYCASEGLATAVRGLVDRPALSTSMQLRPDQKIILAQSVGYP